MGPPAEFLRVRGFALAVLLGGSMPGDLDAQAPACTFDTAAAVVLEPLVVGLAPAGPDLGLADGPDEVITAASVLRTHFRPPAAGVRLPFWALIALRDSVAEPAPFAAAPEPDAALGFGLDDVLAFELDRRGRVRLRSIRIGSASPQLNQALIAALLAADSVQAFSPPSDSSRREGGVIRLRLVAYDRVSGPAVPLFRVSVPAIRAVTQPVEVVHFPPLRLPASERQGHFPGNADIVFVVKEDGTADRETVHMLRGATRGTLEAIMAALRGARFRPARVGECPVPFLLRRRVLLEEPALTR